MKRLNLLILFVLLVASSLSAQDRLSVFLGNANQYARVELGSYRQRLCREYHVSDRMLDRYYRRCGRNWGNVGIALEIAHTSGKKMDDVCRYYDKYHRHGWGRVLLELGIGPNSRYHDSFYDRIHHHSNYWGDCYHSYCKRHPKFHKHPKYQKKHKHHKHRRPHRYYDDDDDDDDDDD